MIMVCVMQVGEQSLNLCRNPVLAAAWTDSVPATSRPSVSLRPGRSAISGQSGIPVDTKN